jgi:nucleoside-diphosphate-sugar epimerase
MICAITGSSGVLGSYIIKNNPTVKFLKFKGDISNEIEIKNWILKKKFDVFLHLAAIVPTTEIKKNYKLAKDVNYYANKNIVNTLLLKENIFFFYASSSHVYPSSLKKLRENTKPKPLTIYGRLKYSSEKYIIKKFKDTKNNYCIGRIFSFTHHKQKKNFLIPGVYKKIKISRNNKEIDFKDTNHNRDFISIKDINSCIFFLLKNKARGIYNIASGKKINLQKLIKIICKRYKKIPKFLKNNNSTTLVADINKVKKMGWVHKDNLIKILNDYESGIKL